jgi:hypothetical protein
LFKFKMMGVGAPEGGKKRLALGMEEVARYN